MILLRNLDYQLQFGRSIPRKPPPTERRFCPQRRADSRRFRLPASLDLNCQKRCKMLIRLQQDQMWARDLLRLRGSATRGRVSKRGSETIARIHGVMACHGANACRRRFGRVRRPPGGVRENTSLEGTVAGVVCKARHVLMLRVEIFRCEWMNDDHSTKNRKTRVRLYIAASHARS